MDTRKTTQVFKGVAILFVLLCHVHQTFELPGNLNHLFSFLQIGVQLFMLLSCYGLCFSYQKNPVKWPVFMKQRFSKIAVFYWFAIALAAVYRCAYSVVMHTNTLQELNPIGILVNALFLHGFSPDSVINNQIVRGGWYIGTLVVIYALFPAMYKLYFKQNKKWAAIRAVAFPMVVFGVTFILRFALQNLSIFHTIEKLLLQLPVFALGFSLFDLQTKDALRCVKVPFCTGALFFALACALYFSDVTGAYIYVFSIGIAFFFFAIGVFRNQTLLAAINNNRAPIIRFLSALGKYSYEIYLTHSYVAFDFCFFATALLSRIYAGEWLWFVLLTPLVVALSYYVGKIFSVVVSKITKPHA